MAVAEITAVMKWFWCLWLEWWNRLRGVFFSLRPSFFISPQGVLDYNNNNQNNSSSNKRLVQKPAFQNFILIRLSFLIYIDKIERVPSLTMTSSEGPQTSRQALRASRLLVKRWRAPSRWWSTGKHTRCLVIYIIWVPSLMMEILEILQGSNNYGYVEAKLII